MTPLRDRARGYWPHILQAIGVDAKYLKKATPCPLCGGRDRFQFYDTNGDGTWFCRGCGKGSGIALVMRFRDLEFGDAAKLIERHIGRPVDVKPVRPVVRAAANPDPKLRTMWANAKPVAQGDVVDTYLRARGIGLDVYPSTIRTAPSLRYFDDDASSVFPAMLALVHDITGKPVSIHRTYLAKDGSGKAPVEKPRKTVCKHGKGPHIRLASIAPVMGIAEGIETALSAMKLFGFPTWSVISTYGIETFEPSTGVKRLIIFGDHDANGAGQKAGHALATRIGGQIPVEVRIPDQAGDWNDELHKEETHEKRI